MPTESLLETLKQLSTQLNALTAILVTELNLTTMEVNILFIAKQVAEPITIDQLSAQIGTSISDQHLKNLVDHGFLSFAKTDIGTPFIAVTQGGYDAVVNAEFIFERNLRNSLNDKQYGSLQQKMTYLIDELRNVQSGLDSAS